MKMKIELLILLMVANCQSMAQEVSGDKASVDVNRLEQLITSEEPSLNASGITQIVELTEDPIDLNHADELELLSLGILNHQQIHGLFNYISRHGKLLSIYEVQAIPEWDLEVIHQLLPYVYVNPFRTHSRSTPFMRRFLQAKNNYLVLRIGNTLEKKAGFKQGERNLSAYAGSGWKWLVKYRASVQKDFSVGLTLEKDAGESFKWDVAKKQFGVDYISWHLLFKNRGRFKQTIIGDYSIQLGQGLLMAAGFNPGKNTTSLIQSKKNHLGILPHTSSVESGFLHGIASTYTIKNFDLTFFASSKNLDASTEFDATGSKSLVKSIQESGLHRTESERSKYKILMENIVGINLSRKNHKGNLHYGISQMYHGFGQDWVNSQSLHRKLEARYQHNLYVQSHAELSLLNATFFGEFVLQLNGGSSLLVGNLVNFTHKIFGALIFRRYSPRYYSRFGSGFGEYNNNSNETGLYWGLQYNPSKYTHVLVYVDAFQHPWLRFSIDRPEMGFEYFFGIRHRLKKATEIRFNYKTEKKSMNLLRGGQKLPTIKSIIKQHFNLNFRYSSHSQINLLANIQFSKTKLGSNTSSGFSISQDVNLKFNNLKLSTRLVLFDTRTFENRHYRYERDVLYTLSIPALSGDGMRYYALFQYKLSRKFDIWLRFARTRYNDRSSIGNGSETIDRPFKSDFKLQMRYSFR